MFEHSGRLLYIQTPLGDDVLHLESFTMSEGFSAPWACTLELISSEEQIGPGSIIGKAVAFQVIGDDGPLSTWHGFVSSLHGLGLHPSGMRSYVAEVVPWTWFLTKRTNCQIFQEMSVKEIVRSIFEAAGYTDFEFKLTRDYPKLEYCVQYRETDHDFFSRLLEEEGIYYYFRHEADRHVLVIADSTSAYFPSEQDSMEYTEGSLRADALTSWEHGFNFISGHWASNDYDFKKPGAVLSSSVSTVRGEVDTKAMARFEYPGRYVEAAHGESKTKALIEAEEATFETAMGQSACPFFKVGATFSLKSHAFPSEEGKEYVVATVTHAGREGSFTQAGDSSDYHNTIECLPKAVVYRPKRVTPRPVVSGPQTAVVVGPEDIHTDEFGRIKVRFFWDRGEESESCWVRVAQSLAGNQWGAHHLPRRGQEVVVNFLDGDPDRPLVTGSVYNGDKKPPFELPGEKTKSGLRTSTVQGGAEDFNELSFEDKKGKEFVFLRAQRTFHQVVKNSAFETVGGNENRTVHGDALGWVKGEVHERVTGEQFVHLEADSNLRIEGERFSQVSADHHVVDNDLVVSAGGDHSTTVSGSHKLKATDSSRDVGAIHDKAQSEIGMQAGQAVHIKGGMNVVVEAGLQLTLKAGGGFITIGPAGVDISGPMVKINSGGAAGSGGGCSPKKAVDPVGPPVEPKKPMSPRASSSSGKAGKGKTATAKSKKASAEWVSPQADALKSASDNGAALCPT